MPSERRRQRQQRVRHEAGDAENSSYFTSTITEAESNTTVENEVTQSNETKGQDREMKPTTDSFKNDRMQHLDSNQSNRRNRMDSQEFDNRNHSSDRREQNQNQNYRGRGHYNSRGNSRDHRARGYGRSQGPPPTPVINSNVALAEETEYEPVSIMPSTSAPKEEESSGSKYRRREVISNWLQYDELPSENDLDDGEDYLRGEDFSEILKQNELSGSSGYLHLKGERTWGDVDTSYLSSHGLGALKVSELVSALQTIPLHTLLEIPTKKLPNHTISHFTNLALDNAKLYKPNAEYVTDIEVNDKIIEGLKISSDSLDFTSSEATNAKVNPIDATLKFSSAFFPEPDDVDLDDLIRERTPEESTPREITPQPNQIHSPTCEGKKETTKKKKTKPQETQRKSKTDTTPCDNVKQDNVHGRCSMSPEVKDSQPTFNFGLPKEAPSSKEFNFGLSHTQNNKKDSSIIKPHKAENTTREDTSSEEKKETPEEPAIDLDAPIVDKDKKPILLVTKTETENLEDWLDSVLDD